MAAGAEKTPASDDKEASRVRPMSLPQIVQSGHVSDVAVDARVDKQERGEPPQAPRTFATLTRVRA
jgi:hypothetical protein